VSSTVQPFQSFYQYFLPILFNKRILFTNTYCRLKCFTFSDPPLFSFRVCCGYSRTKNRIRAKAKDLADTSSSWFYMIQTMQEFQDTGKHCQCRKSCAKKNVKKNSVVPEVPEEGEHSRLIVRSKSEKDDFKALQHTAKRLVNRVSLMKGFTDMMFFVEVLMPEKAKIGAQTSEALYAEMDHNSLFIEGGG
jgi:hypothetical protein